ncbi:MAG TPA: TIGR03560 family F420-dependent LLM class oxidoreductase [Acidimicrobiia bacterium]|nr:TIGR03560 family F420-dependent LLM class oxidoreductase [Acidimicrobiia bacterium]
MKFGVHAGLQNTSTGELQQLWRRIEGHGFEWISIWDHFYAADATGGAVCLEAVATHAALALSTERVRCGSLVYSVGYRHPAVLANSMATIDHLSGGRVTLGLGAGWHQGEYDAYGMPFPAAGVRLRQLDEAIQCVRGLLTQDVTNFEGDHFRLHDARCEPKPVQDRLPIWIGGGGEKVTLRIAARHADGWNVPFIPPDEYGRKVAVLDAHCEREGRDPGEITRAVNVGLAWREEDLQAQFSGIADFVRPGVLTGSTQEIVDRVAAYGDAGAEWVILAIRAPFDVDGLDRFAADVLPAFSS